MQKHKLLFASVMIAFLAAAPARASEDEQLWTAVNAGVKLGGKWQVNQELTTRYSDNRKGLYEIEAVTLLGYKLTKDVTIAGGYVHNPLYNAGDFRLVERRARQQVTVDNIAQLAGGKFSARMRIEQRWRENQDKVGWRLRPYVKYSRPFSKGSKTSLSLSNETYVNLNTTAYQSTQGFDRMRNAVSINQKLTPTLSVEAGYLNQYGFVRRGDDTMDHAATLSIGLSL